MLKSVVLSGGAEFEPESNELNRAGLRLTRQRSPHVVIVPVAAVENPRRTVRAGERYFDSLGARTEHVMVVTAENADRGERAVQASAMEHADVIYLTDGSPLDAVKALQGTEAFAILRRAYEAGVVLMACGASAMALGAYYWDGGVWEPGLGLFRGIAILPHHENISARFSPTRLRQTLPADTLILGLDDATGVMLDGNQSNPRQIRVTGGGTVTVYGAVSETEFTDGQVIRLQQPFGDIALTANPSPSERGE